MIGEYGDNSDRSSSLGFGGRWTLYSTIRMGNSNRAKEAVMEIEGTVRNFDRSQLKGCIDCAGLCHTLVLKFCHLGGYLQGLKKWDSVYEAKD